MIVKLDRDEIAQACTEYIENRLADTHSVIERTESFYGYNKEGSLDSKVLLGDIEMSIHIKEAMAIVLTTSKENHSLEEIGVLG